MKSLSISLLLLSLGSAAFASIDVPTTDPNIAYSPYNWFKSGSSYAQTPNPGAYLKVGFTGSKIAVKIDTSPFIAANVPASHYPLVRFSIDGGPAKTIQLAPNTTSILCGTGLPRANHNLLLQYVSGYVFLDFWTPVNVLRVTGLSLDDDAILTKPSASEMPRPRTALFLGDSITNGDDDVADFVRGITNEVDTQDATIGYPAVVAAGLGAEYGVVAYGGASWDGSAADGHTPGLMATYSKIDSQHSRLVGSKLSPVPDDVFINMGENVGPSGDDVPKLLTALRSASSSRTNIFVIIPFSGRARTALTNGFHSYKKIAPVDSHTFLLDLGNCPYLPVGRPTMLSVDGQHPLAALHAQLGAQILQARADQLNSAVKGR